MVVNIKNIISIYLFQHMTEGCNRYIPIYCVSHFSKLQHLISLSAKIYTFNLSDAVMLVASPLRSTGSCDLLQWAVGLQQQQQQLNMLFMLKA